MQPKILIIALILVSILAFIIYRSFKSPQPGLVVLINGISSTGKSAIIAELQKMHPEYKLFNVDETWPDDLKRKAESLGWNSQSQFDPWMFLHNYLTEKDGVYYLSTQVRQKLFDEKPTFYKAAKEQALKGTVVLIDPVFEYEKEYDIFADYFKDMKTIKILVYCPMDILMARVEQRNKSSIKEEQRTAIQSFEQFPGNYKLQEHSDEPVVDRVKTSVLKKALDDALEQLLKYEMPAGYLPVFEKFKQDFIKQFKLDQVDEIILVPKHHYDLILNSSNKTPQALAERIEEFIKKN